MNDDEENLNFLKIKIEEYRNCIYYDNSNNYDENKLIEFALFINEVLINFKKISIHDYMTLIFNLLEQFNLSNLMFYDLWFILIISELPLEEYKNFNLIIDLLHCHMKCLDKENRFKIFDNFNEKIMKKVLNENINNHKTSNFIQILYNFLPFYQKIREVFSKYFDRNFILNFINRDKIFNENIIKTFEENKINLDLSEINVEYFLNLIKLKEYSNILKMMRILIFNKNYLENYFKIFLSSFRKYYQEIFSDYLKNKNALIFFETIYEYENFLFTDDNLSFFDLDKYYKDFLKLISEILNTKNTKSRIFAEALDLIIRLKNEKQFLFKIIFNNLEMIEDFEKFEEDYSFLLIQRSLDEVFDKIKETELIEKIMQKGKDKFKHYHKLQTLINNIKISRKGALNLVGIPSHCYHNFNLGCKPNFNDIEMINLFENVKPLGKFPQNSKLIFQQGSVEFSIKKIPNILIKVNPIQFIILKFVSVNYKDVKEILNHFEISIELFNFLIQKLEENKLIIKNNNDSNFEYKMNNIEEIAKLFKNLNNPNLNLFADIFKYNKEFSLTLLKNEKEINYIIDCYIMKFMKKNKKCNFNSIKSEIMNTKVFNINECEENRIKERLDYLIEKTLVKKIENDLYIYS